MVVIDAPVARLKHAVSGAMK